jgi:hypothetical protein
VICCICNQDIDVQYTSDGEVEWTEGHNPEPVVTGSEARCCSFCNGAIVIPERVKRYYESVRRKASNVTETT